MQGLCVVQDNIDYVVKTIRTASTPDEAKKKLMETLWIPLEMVRILDPEATEPQHLSAEQAQAILDMRLSRLTQLEKSKLLEERDQLIEAITKYRRILGDVREVWAIVREELLEVKKKYADERRTEITDAATDMPIESLIPDENMVITITHSGYIKRTPTDQYRRQRRGGAVHGVRLWPYPERKLMRVGFEVDPGNDNLSELRLVLQSGGQPVSETWLNRWTW